MSESRSVRPTVDAITEAMTDVSAVRDKVIVQGRQAIRHAANSIRALHRGDFDEGDRLLAECRGLVGAMREATAGYPEIFLAGYTQDAMKEYAEAEITGSLLRDRDVPPPSAIGVEPAAWLNGLAEAGSELRRDVLDALRRGDAETGVRLLDVMDDIYSALVTVDFPDAITGGLRRTTDQFRAVLERTRGDLTLTIQQRRLQDAIERLQSELRTPEAPGS